jgi:hypothetical protein
MLVRGAECIEGRPVVAIVLLGIAPGVAESYLIDDGSHPEDSPRARLGQPTDRRIGDMTEEGCHSGLDQHLDGDIPGVNPRHPAEFELKFLQDLFVELLRVLLCHLLGERPVVPSRFSPLENQRNHAPTATASPWNVVELASVRSRMSLARATSSDDPWTTRRSLSFFTSVSYCTTLFFGMPML